MKKDWTQGLKSNSGLTLIELIVSVVVSSVVVLSAVMFFSLALSQYRNTVQETDLMTESQIAVNLMREVVMEASESIRPIPTEPRVYAGKYPWFAVMTGKGVSETALGIEQLFHLFLLDPDSKTLFYYRDAEATYDIDDAEVAIENVFFSDGSINANDRRNWFLAEHVISMEAVQSGQLVRITLGFDCDGRNYSTEEIVLLRNSTALSSSPPTSPPTPTP